MPVTNEQEYREWLEGQPREVCASITYRAAMRVLPAAVLRFSDKTTLPAFRSLLTSATYLSRPLPKLEDAARNAAGPGLLVRGTALEAAFLASKVIFSDDAQLSQIAMAAVLATRMDDVRRVEDLLKVIDMGGGLGTEVLAAAISDANLEPMDLVEAPIVVSARAEEILAQNARGDLNALDVGGPWTFWAKWYDRAMAGDPLPWDLQEQVALIPDAVWKDGPEAVAAEIDRIEAAFELRQRIAEVEADQLLINERRLGIGGNNPPEEIDDPETVQQVVILWESIAGLKEEVEANEPDAERVAALIERLGAALKAVIAWCGRKGDLIVDTTIKSTIGWALPAASGGYFILNPAKAEAVLKAAQSWLPFLAP